MLTANDMGAVFSNPLGMRKKPFQPSKPRPTKVTVLAEGDGDALFIGQWITRLGLQASEIAADAPINEGYLSELISGGKGNPSHAKLRAIARAMDIPVTYLFVEPPPAAAVDAMSQFDTKTIERLKGR